MTDKNDKNQTPAPKVSHAKDPSEQSSSNLKKNIAQAKKAAANSNSATKTPGKVQG